MGRVFTLHALTEMVQGGSEVESTSQFLAYSDDVEDALDSTLRTFGSDAITFEVRLESDLLRPREHEGEPRVESGIGCTAPAPRDSQLPALDGPLFLSAGAGVARLCPAHARLIRARAWFQAVLAEAARKPANEGRPGAWLHAQVALRPGNGASPAQGQSRRGNGKPHRVLDVPLVQPPHGA